ncbi:MAG: accB [Phenylobacterium sp.]|nr:accB [Phenylobacterium sp.]
MASSPKAPADPIDARLVRKLADILTDTGLSEIEVEHGGLKIRVAKQLTAAPIHVAAPAPAPMPTPAVQTSATAPAPAAEAPRHAGEVVKSPMVGTVYMQAQPDSPPFIKVGDSVQAGQTLMIIEAMKTMNPIPAAKSGVVRAILVTDGDPVEFGEPLAIVE